MVSFVGRPRRDQSSDSENIPSFQFEADTRPNEDLISKITSLVASMPEGLLVAPALADLELQDPIEFALQDLISEGLAESLVVAAFLNYFVLGIGDVSFSRDEVRTLRKLYRAAFVKSGLDPETTGQRILDALASVEDWEDVIAAGFVKAVNTS